MSALGEQAWSPPVGRHPVNVGGSLARSLKVRKGLPTKANKNLPVSDYYLFRYKFKPESIDNSRPGTVEVTRGDEKTTLRMERASHQADEVHVFRGVTEPPKDVDCVLIYNEEDGMFTLEKLDSSMNLSYDGRVPQTRHSASPLPTPSPAPSVSKQEDDLQAELDRELFSTLDTVETVEEKLPNSSAIRVKRNNPSKQQPKAPAVVPPVIPPAIPPPQPTPQPNPPPVVAKGKGKTRKEQLKEPPPLDVEEEILEFGAPSIPVVAPRADTPPFTLQEQTAAVESDETDEWDEVAGLQTASGAGDGSIFGDEMEEEVGEEIDLNQFEAEMNLELGLEEEEPGSAHTGPPMSLKAFASGGAMVQDDEDDYSSSDDSDDD